MTRTPITAATFLLAAALCAPAQAKVDWAKVGEALGKAGVIQPDGVYRIGLPRTDLQVTLDGVTIKPAMALGSWVAFEAMGDEATVMGDFVLTADEVNPVMKRLAEAEVEITALHNHLLRASPATMYMHILGRGDPVALAKSLHAALALSGTPLVAASGDAPAQPLNLDTAKLEAMIGYAGKESGGVYQVSVPRAETIEDGTMKLPNSMGTAIAINFQPTGGGTAAITGDFVLTAREVNPVLRALREHGIEVTALHSHMLNEEPRLFFMHFWANDGAERLAEGLRAALDQMNVKKG